jgi:hypothetical protein
MNADNKRFDRRSSAFIGGYFGFWRLGSSDSDWRTEFCKYLFSPRGTSVPLRGSQAKASRGLKPALHDLVAAVPRCATICPTLKRQRGILAKA